MNKNKNTSNVEKKLRNKITSNIKDDKIPQMKNYEKKL